MGIQLVKLVVARLGDLPGPAYKLLTYMALTALDSPNAKGQPPRLYFGGRGGLALALGYPVDVDDRGREVISDAAESAIKRALKVLRTRGLITDMQQAKTGTNQSYRLNLAPSDLRERGTPSDPQPPRERGVRPATPTGVRPATPTRGVRSDPTGVRPATPQGRKEDRKQDLSQDSTTHPSAQPPGHTRPPTTTNHLKPATIPRHCPSCSARMPKDGECPACGWQHPEGEAATA